MSVAGGATERAHNLELLRSAAVVLAIAAALVVLGCGIAQGYLIARPMPGDHLLDWVHQDRSHLRL